MSYCDEMVGCAGSKVAITGGGGIIAGALAGALLFLVSTTAAGFVTGVTVPVDGGHLVDNI
jgi:hypothetical protein